MITERHFHWSTITLWLGQKENTHTHTHTHREREREKGNHHKRYGHIKGYWSADSIPCLWCYTSPFT